MKKKKTNFISILDSTIKEMKRFVELGVITKPPRHRKFKKDERVVFGAHKEVYVREVCDGGHFYIIESINVKRDKSLPPSNEHHCISWVNLLPYVVNNTKLRKEDDSRISQINSSIDSLLNMVYYQGVDFEVEYQREHVWKRADKVALIDSIFNNIDIGKFVLVQRDYSNEIGYEIIDGKQRLTTLKEFYEDRFKYKGYYYSELSGLDRHKFREHSIVYGYLENPTKKTIFETFIKLNTCGKPMASKHITHVQNLLDEL